MVTLRTLALSTAALGSLALAGCGGADSGSRDQVRAVGSSTVYPFAKAVAEQLAKSDPSIKSPIIESTGTGAGMKLFCAGVGPQHPDIEDASRRMKKSEFDECVANGVKDITEIQVGLDGVAFAEAKGGANLALTPEDIYKALAKNPYGKPNTAKTWADVNPALPADPILVYGPPSTSGTRDALKELILAKGCDANPEMKALKDSDKKKHDDVCTQVREDGVYVDAGENDNLIVQKIEANPKAIGIFGFSYVESNADRIKGLTMSGITPTYETISNFSYPGARPLYIYVKKAHLKAIPGLQAYVTQWSKLWGKDGTLAKLGMVVAPDAVLAESAKAVTTMPSLDGSQLK
ncbi:MULTISPECIES: substrate-binding domain-containing protein [unclassified Novosphingobium]|uniref:substrate-binding domain-containing protein n=1 Tax=unclassified Novosphingobium TaxID=2644732 RepID=UPI000D2F7188|nr:MULTISPECIES: substrate-binding domain-containing protein [unclassified Novosphingobium]PTR12716.1 phosphate ABC transporter substrate-binding protein (PhoT family) [Novosphingobium sp. GV055]PUB06500.1 phosphate ABC transporter substrate-binding protein (PhoT family) [Novosphingobium sp. GV061]PUB22551.1 phosphate ABC transporter substrate-binding protein (PhoT family) [Novosphingobium sp. GV079]PUB44576.1 phosphate ABC transporter substrate-binding protein (PhoT family) [Novosphingobium sp